MGRWLIIHRYETSLQTFEQIGDNADYISIACLAIGFPEGALAAQIIGTTADLAKLTLKAGRALESGDPEDISDFWISLGIEGMNFGVSALIEKKVAKISINVGKNDQFYQLGRKGALKKWNALRKQMIKDLTLEVGGKTAEEIADKTYEMIKPIFNDEKK